MIVTYADLLETVDYVINESARSVRESRLVPLEIKLERGLERCFRAESRAFLKRFGRLTNASKWPPDDAQWMKALDEAQAEMNPQYLQVIRQYVGDALKMGMVHTAEQVEPVSEAGPDEAVVTMGVSFGLQNPRAVSYMDQHGAALVRNIDETTRDYLKTILTDAVQKGESYDRVARRINERYAEFAVGRPQLDIDSRAHLIAVTEIGNAYAEGNLEMAQKLADLGLKIEKAWDTMGDDRVSELCMNNESQGYIPLEDTFQSGHMRPLGHPACRCDMLTRRVGTGTQPIERPPLDPDMFDIPVGRDLTKWDKEWENSLLRKLTADEQYAISRYTGSEYRKLNYFLQHGEPKAPGKFEVSPTILTREELEQFRDRLDSAMVKLGGANRDLSVWRGASPTIFKDIPPDRLLGTIYTDPRFVSTTLDAERAKTFAGKYLMHILVPESTPGAYVAGISFSPGEMEFLLARGLTYRVIGVEGDPVGTGLVQLLVEVVR